MDIKIIKITAMGTNLRLMTIKMDNEQITVRITDKTYKFLKNQGIPTGQSLRKKN